MPANLSALEALDRLRAGNIRFAANVISIDSLVRQLDRAALTRAQAPFAVVLGCSDSRAPAELVFGQGLGDLFVIRVAGNVVSPSQVGSVEFAAEWFGCRLVVVMGHTHCGVIGATLEAVEQGSPPGSENVMSIVERVRPAVEAARLAGGDRAAVARAAGRINVRMAVEHLRHGTPALERLLTNEGLMVIGPSTTSRPGGSSSSADRRCPAADAPMPHKTLDLSDADLVKEPADPVPPLAPGELLDGRYRISRLIAEGGMGAVYEAEAVRIGRPVAVKVLHPRFAASPLEVERFRREARVAVQVSSPHVVEMLDFGQAASGELFLVMELLRGESLRDRLAREGFLPPLQVADLMRQLLRGLAAAHAVGVTHRDLKPDNLWLVPEAGRERLTILDFGIAKQAGGTRDRPPPRPGW